MTTLLMMRTDENINQCQSSGMNGDESLPTAPALLFPSLSPPTTVIPSTQELPSSMGGIVTDKTTKSSHQIQNTPQKRKKPTLDNAPSSDVAGHDDDGGTDTVNKKTKHSGRNQTAQTTGGGGNEISAAKPTSMQTAFQAFLRFNAAYPPPPGAMFQYLPQFQHPQPPPGLFLFSPLPYYPTHPLHHPHGCHYEYGCYNQHNYRHDGHVTNEAVENELYSNDGWLDGEEAKAAKAAAKKEAAAAAKEAKAAAKKEAAAAKAKAAEAAREEERAAWYSEQRNNCETAWKDYFEDTIEQGRLNELVKLLQELLQRYNAEKDERKRECYIKGITEFSALLADYIMNVDLDGYDVDAKSKETMLRGEYTNMGYIERHSGKQQKTYLLNLRRRKDARGRSNSEASRVLWQRLQEKKKEYYAMREEYHKELADEFGKEAADRAAKIIRACTDPNSEDIKGSWGGFSQVEAEKIAYRKTEQMLVLAANKYNLKSINDFLPDNMSLKECLEINREDKKELNRLHQEAMEKSKERAAERAAKSGGDVKVEEKYVNSHGTNSLISFLGILNHYDDIVDSLVDKKAAMIEHPDSNKPPIMLVTIPNELDEEKCIGREILEKLGLLGNVKLTSYVKGTFVIEIFSGEEYIRLYKVTEDKITRVKFGIDTSDNLFTFNCHLPRDKEHESEAKWKSSSKQWTLHRLKQVVYSNLGLGINNRDWFRNYFELADGETFEDKFSYYEFDADAAKQRYQRMNANGWEDVELASQCDGDHLLGRLCMWMCESIFVLPCSHSWNQCMGKARKHMGCWGFGFAHIKYDGGN